eukprot:TRINITY_DN29744_c0_g1_i1.p1 TRINITY_DN29744_c0_g1~~TRINITY_DN29744_c0_g1_i1.p1  ORF type:complete len:152 (+),score=48.30 TRINITY_DN29744_c0_g1_i1:87-542(+)
MCIRDSHHRAYLGLPQTMELTRRFLAKAPAAKAKEIVGEHLCEDLGRCEDRGTLEDVQAVLKFMCGVGRFKKDLGGVDLSTALKQTCRTSINRATSVCGGFEVQRTVHSAKSQEYKIECRDVRLDDADKAERQVADMSLLVDQALDKAHVN